MNANTGRLLEERRAHVNGVTGGGATAPIGRPFPHSQSGASALPVALPPPLNNNRPASLRAGRPPTVPSDLARAYVLIVPTDPRENTHKYKIVSARRSRAEQRDDGSESAPVGTHSGGATVVEDAASTQHRTRVSGERCGTRGREDGAGDAASATGRHDDDDDDGDDDGVSDACLQRGVPDDARATRDADGRSDARRPMSDDDRGGGRNSGGRDEARSRRRDRDDAGGSRKDNPRPRRTPVLANHRQPGDVPEEEEQGATARSDGEWWAGVRTVVS